MLFTKVNGVRQPQPPSFDGRVHEPTLWNETFPEECRIAAVRRGARFQQKKVLYFFFEGNKQVQPYVSHDESSPCYSMKENAAVLPLVC